MFGWIGTITGIMGGLLLALNLEYSNYGFFIFFISASSWTIQGYKNNDRSLMILNAFFMLIDLLGIYRWIF